MAIDYEWVRAQFPMLANLKDDFTFLDNAGGTFPCVQSNQISEKFYNQYKLQPFGITETQAEAGRLMDAGKADMAETLGVQIADLTYGPSTTQNLTNLANALTDYIVAGDEIIVTIQDHEANIGCWERLASLKQAKLVFWQVDAGGELHLDELKKILSPKTKMLSFTHSSNIIGSVNDVNAIAKLVADKCPQKPLIIVDGVSYAPHNLPNITDLNIDAYCFSSYKTFGTHLGIMYTSNRLAKIARPQCHFFNVGVKNYSLFDAAGPDHAAIASLAGISAYYKAFAQHHGLNDAANLNEARIFACKIMAEAETKLLYKLLEFLATKPNVTIYGKKTTMGREANISFTVDGKSSKSIYEALGAKNIGVKYGHFYAYRLIEALGLDLEDGVVRLSYAHYLTPHDNDRLIAALDEIL
ncbi:MAG: aminotransferase class V-fold PLP-dependent enzyme [Rhizobiales bacterium]|nr:aminotransferase class V-fold PLP-dependent enzyme [Hyphomicrobiales bacterium]NRB13430.1 aminotransferase class V-fold PLP-dependent enzyme [Hyphomicrobiales bacterium]